MSEVLFEQSPEPTDKHILNYLDLLGQALVNFRKQHPIKACRSQERFLELKIQQYFRKPVNRKTLMFVERGDHKVNFGLYAAVLHEMGVWPEIINAISSGTKTDIAYVELVVNELREKQKKVQLERMKSLSQQYFNEIG